MALPVGYSLYSDNVYDQYGRPIPDVDVYIYIQQTGALASIVDPSGVPIANPTATNVDGLFTFGAPDGLYVLRFVRNGQPRFQDKAVQIGPVAPLPDSILLALADPGGASLVGSAGPSTVQADINAAQADIANRAARNLSNVILDGSVVTITTTGGAQADKVGENILATNSTTVGQYSLRFAALTKTGRMSGGVNDIADTLITRHDDIGSGFVWGGWRVLQSPLAVGSGLPGAPVAAQAFAMFMGEHNPQNRHGNTGWEPENRAYANWVGGIQWVPETQDFSSLLGNTRVGYHITFAQSYAKSPYASNFGGMAGKHARFYNIDLINPNAIVGGGFGTFATGLKDFPTAVAISAAGTGYAVGDLIVFNTGLGQGANQDSTLKVTSINGGGGVTGVEIYDSGWYQQSFASPVGVTGGTGTGATFTYTMSTASEIPQGMIGLAGFWEAAINCVPRTGANGNVGQGQFSRGVIVAPNNNNIIVARDAANAVDVVGLKLNASDNWELAAKEIIPWTAFSPTVTGDTGAPTVTLGLCRYSKINGTVFVNITFTLNTVATATGALRVSEPVPSAAGYVPTAMNASDGVGLVASGGTAGVIRFFTTAGAFPGIAGKSYAITAMYEAA